MLKLVRGWLLTICCTVGFPILGQTASYTGDPHPCDNGLPYIQGIPIYSWENNQPYQGSPFLPRDPRKSHDTGL